MTIIEVVLLALALSMDAFSVAMCKGMTMKKFGKKNASIIAFVFGFFQAGMTLIGFLLGSQYAHYIKSIDHFIAFGLLGAIGAKMVFDSFKQEQEEQDNQEQILSISNLLVMGVATSIDALAVGVTLAFLSTNIALASTLIGVITLVLCYIGVFIGHKVGAKLKDKAEFIGGIVLILIGTKILFEHLGWLF